MRIAVDLHIHSRFSRATSKQLTLSNLEYWARKKGVKILGTGDFTHPKWRQEMHEELIEDGSGLLKIKPQYQKKQQQESQQTNIYNYQNQKNHQEEDYHVQETLFLLTTELSTIYKHNGKTRKIHHVFLAPDLKTVEKISKELIKRKVNIHSDGRPIMGLSSQNLCELIFSANPQCQLIPAHIWTPWFAVLGSKGGYDSLEECYGQYTDKILALETGLSSDPQMNWRVSNLDKYTLVSNSDAHSPSKIAREANILNWDPQQTLTYDWIVKTIKNGNEKLFPHTIEFYPQEGKYHWDGHRNCQIQWRPEQTHSHKGICPVCNQPVTVGVQHRIDILADQPVGRKKITGPKPIYLIPLEEIISAIEKKGVKTKHVQKLYEKLIYNLGSELSILLNKDHAQLAQHSNESIAQGIIYMRQGKVSIDPGYDGEFGHISIKVA